MSDDPRAALAVFMNALERHFELASSGRNPDDPHVEEAADSLVDAWDRYDDALHHQYGVSTPFFAPADGDEDDDFDDEDDDLDEDDDEDDEDVSEDDADDSDDDADDDSEDDEDDEDDDGLDEFDDDEDTTSYLGLDDEDIDYDDE